MPQTSQTSKSEQRLREAVKIFLVANNDQPIPLGDRNKLIDHIKKTQFSLMGSRRLSAYELRENYSGHEWIGWRNFVPSFDSSKRGGGFIHSKKNVTAEQLADYFLDQRSDHLFVTKKMESDKAREKAIREYEENDNFAKRLYPMLYYQDWEKLSPDEQSELMELFNSKPLSFITTHLFFVVRSDPHLPNKKFHQSFEGCQTADDVIKMAKKHAPSTISSQIIREPKPKKEKLDPLVEATKNARISYDSNNNPSIDDENAMRYYRLLCSQHKDEHLERERLKKVDEFRQAYRTLHEEYEKINENYEEYKKFQSLELYHEKQQSNKIQNLVANQLDFNTKEIFQKRCEAYKKAIEKFDIECSERRVKRLSIKRLFYDGGDSDFKYIHTADEFDEKINRFMEVIELDSSNLEPNQIESIKNAFKSISLKQLEEEQRLERLYANEKRIHYYEFFMGKGFEGGSTELTDSIKQTTEDFLGTRKAFLDSFADFMPDYPNSTSIENQNTKEKLTKAERKLKEMEIEQLNYCDTDLRTRENKPLYKKVMGFFFRKPQAQPVQAQPVRVRSEQDETEQARSNNSIVIPQELKGIDDGKLRLFIDKEKESRAEHKLKEMKSEELNYWDQDLKKRENKPLYKKFMGFFSRKPQAQPVQAQPVRVRSEQDETEQAQSNNSIVIPRELKGIDDGKLRLLIDKEKESRKVLDNIWLKGNKIKAVKDAFKEEMIRINSNYSSLSLGFDITTKEELKSGSIAFKKDGKTYLFKKNDSETRLKCYTADGNILFEFETDNSSGIFTELENNLKLKTIKEIIDYGKFSDSGVEYGRLKKYKVKKDGDQLKLFYEEREVFSSGDTDIMGNFDKAFRKHEDDKNEQIKREIRYEMLFPYELQYDFDKRCYYFKAFFCNGKLIMSGDKIEYEKGDAEVVTSTDEEFLRSFKEKINSHERQMKLKIEDDLSLSPDLKYDFANRCYYIDTSFGKLIMSGDEIKYQDKGGNGVYATKDEEYLMAFKDRISKYEDYMNKKIITQIMGCKDFIYLTNINCYRIEMQDGQLIIGDDEIKYRDKNGKDVYATKDSDVLRVFKEKEKEKKESILEDLVSNQSELMYFSDDVMNRQYGIHKSDTGSSSILFEKIIHDGKSVGCPKIYIDNVDMFDQLSSLSMIKEMREEELVRDALSNSSFTMDDYKFVKSADGSLEISKKGVKLEELGMKDIEMFRKYKRYLEITDDKLIIGSNIFLFSDDGNEVSHKISGSDNEIKITDLELRQRLLNTKEQVEKKMKEAIEVDVKQQEKKFHEIDRKRSEILKQQRDLEDKIREEEYQMQLEINKQTNAKIKERENILGEFNDLSKLRLDGNGNLVSDTFIFKLNRSRIDVFKHDDETKQFTSLDNTDKKFEDNKKKLSAIQRNDLFGGGFVGKVLSGESFLGSLFR